MEFKVFYAKSYVVFIIITKLLLKNFISSTVNCFKYELNKNDWFIFKSAVKYVVKIFF